MRTIPCRYLLIGLAAALMVAFLPTMPGLDGNAHAASVKCKSKYYVTTTINKSTLKKNKKARVTVKIANTSGNTMKDLKLKVKLPAELKLSKGKLSKSKSSLGKGKTYSYSFYVKAKKKITFIKKVTTSKAVSKTQSKIVARNAIKSGKVTKYSSVTFTFKKPVDTPKPVVVGDPSSYAQSMVDLLASMNTYAKKTALSKNPKFAMIANGGYLLYHPDAKTKDSMLAAIDGALIEESFTDDDTKAMQESLAQAASKGKKAFSIEYAPFTGSDSVVSYDANGISDLDQIPAYQNANVYDVNSLNDVQSFMALLDPSKNYNTKTKLFDAIKDTDYDMIFIDLFYDAENNLAFTPKEINALKTKKNGGKRLICSYLSVGEAEDYRYYWQPSWVKENTRPAWIDEENPEWEGNFKVKYWYPEWQSLLYGSTNSYLDRILTAGFDGVYLDVIDAYEYYDERGK